MKLNADINRIVLNDDSVGPDDVLFSIGTIFNNDHELEEMLATFHMNQFAPPTTEFLVIDNTTSNRFDAYSGINAILSQARGRYVIICHQDVRLCGDTKDDLLARLRELDEIAPDWAVAGNAGITHADELAVRISDPHGENQRTGPLPVAVQSLDENFLVLKRAAMVGCSNDLHGFHMYGSDLCIQAALRGHTAHVIDFLVRHLSPGRLGPDFFEAVEALETKYHRAFQSRPLRTTCTRARLTPSRIGLAWARLKRLRKKIRSRQRARSDR